MSNPKQEYGWVIINTEEKRRVFEPRQRTDEFYFGWNSGWRPVVMADTKFSPHEIYRRRISPGEGFEIVPENGVIGARDELYMEINNGWTLASDSVGKSISEAKEEMVYSLFAVRRPIKQPAKDYGTTFSLCGCLDCIKARGELNALGSPNHMVACGNCGNKRCPHAENHFFKCTGSNEPGQVGELEAQQPTTPPVEPCPVAKRVSDRVISRAETGMKKYGVNLERGDLTVGEWLQHLQDELLDAAAYVERLKAEGLKSIGPVEPSPWREIGDLTGLPEEGDVTVAGLTKYGKQYNSTYYAKGFREAVKNGTLDRGLTHWQPISPVPKPKPMTEEEALKQLMDSIPDDYVQGGCLRGWLAHIEFLKKGGK